MDLFAKIVDQFTEIVDLFPKRAVLQNSPNPPGYGPVLFPLRSHIVNFMCQIRIVYLCINR